MDGKVCSRQPSLCARHPSSPSASPPHRDPAVQSPLVPSPRQHSSPLTSPTYVLDPVYFLEDSVSLLTCGTPILGCALGLLFSVTSVLLLCELCVKLFLPPLKTKSAPISRSAFPISIFYFLISKLSVSPAFHPWCSPASALSGTPAN